MINIFIMRDAKQNAKEYIIFTPAICLGMAMINVSEKQLLVSNKPFDINNADNFYACYLE